MLHFFINPISPDSKKNHGPDSLERVHKSPESPKTIEKLESFADHDLGNIQNVTSSMHLINKPLLYRNTIHVVIVLTIGFFKKNSFF